MEPLLVDVVHFYPKENAQPHNTVKYEIVNDEDPTVAIVRRGQPFNGVVRFTRPIDENEDVVQLVSTPVTLPVGCWALRVVTRLKSSPAREIYDFEQDLYILFNPWNPDDQTYMEDCTLLQEYVQNDVGKVWVGPIKTTRGKPWVYGQFDAEYEDGTAPSDWTGSVEILSQYLQTQQEVPYGQCWVFAGVVTTVCRALGIPSRVVSNLVSAHDANSSLTVDKYYTETMEELDYDPNNPAMVAGKPSTRLLKKPPQDYISADQHH
ncbi:hypothetical protein MSG28_008888 [Choristoneura fumiferana]|uniref:Uncharacterized protein n=1 Tax=Choristoneura fumiferana TaxID=7141 RepID=A0ACC0J8B7_CHOFU|nr:hypothetical protein MSG28_008888 [Choristoneura fumiferana]